MQLSENQKTGKFVNDIYCHLQAIRHAIDALQCQHAMDVEHYAICDRVMQRLGFVEKIIQVQRLQLPLAIACKANELFIEDTNLSIVNIQIINSKRSCNPTAIAYFKIVT